MNALKVAVVVMGILIVLGLAVLAYGLVTGIAKTSTGSGTFGNIELPLPAGCTIAEAHAEAGRLIVRVEGPAERGCPRIVVFDLSDGAILGRVGATPAP